MAIRDECSQNANRSQETGTIANFFSSRYSNSRGEWYLSNFRLNWKSTKWGRKSIYVLFRDQIFTLKNFNGNFYN